LTKPKGISWLDDGRIPVAAGDRTEYGIDGDEGLPTVNDFGACTRIASTQHTNGRFPANLLVSDDALNDGTITKSSAALRKNSPHNMQVYGKHQVVETPGIADSGSYSRYFDLDAWWTKTLPFLIIPKAAKSEKNKGLQHMPDKLTAVLPMRSKAGERGGTGSDGSSTDRKVVMKNHHPTVKPLRLMSYLITLFSRPGDTVLDPFVGSGTTCVAAEMLGRESTGIEQEAQYVEIAEARLEYIVYQRNLL
jgi:DNA methylase